MPHYDLIVGESKQTELMIDEMGYELGPISWKLADESIVSFTPEASQTGRPTVTGLQVGTTTLTATLINGVSAQCTITVHGETPVGRSPGDADGDGEVSIADALVILRYSVGWGNPIDMNAADVDDSGMVDLADALLILQYCVGWDVELK